MDYFTNTTPEQRMTIAQYCLYNHGKTALKGKESDEQINEIIQEYCGDQYVRVIAENPAKLVYLSFDTEIQVIVVIDKVYFDNSIAFDSESVLNALKA